MAKTHPHPDAQSVAADPSPDGRPVHPTEHFYEGVVALAADAIVATDAEQRIVLFNRGAEETFGYSADEVIGRPLDVLLPERLAATHRERDVPRFARSAVASRRMAERSDVVGRRKSGEEFPAEVTIASMEVDGEVRFAAILRDVSTRERAQRALRESEDLFRTAMRASPIGMALRGLDGSWIAVNRALAGIVGYTEEELLRLSVRDISHADDLELDMVYAREMLAGTRGPYSREKRYVHKDGHVVWILLSVTLVRSVSGEPRFFIAQMNDISDRKRAEELLAQQREELAASNAELEQFAYVASHDLQEPLRIVASYTQLLAKRYEGKLDEKADRWIGYAVDAARRMQALINDLLALSRVGTHGRSFEPTDCSAVLARAMGSIATAISESGARITSDPLPVAPADAGQLQQLFQNLVGNAIKFRRPEVSPEVHVAARLQTTDGRDEWLLSVSDNGIGLEPEYAEQVFVMFQRLHAQEEYPGTGMGLAICRKIVERHGGRIWVESTPGAGATFHFTLPAEQR
ncbi:MAG TPA: PAS domain S-box protein [Gemmatimonadales bacterium]